MSERNLAPINQLEIGTAVLACDVIYGGIAGLVWGPEAGIQVAIGTTGFMGGTILGLTSMERAQEFAKENRRGRAYVEALRGSFEAAVGLALTGATAGHAIAEIPGTLIGSGVGGIVGFIGFGQISLGLVSRELKARKEG